MSAEDQARALLAEALGVSGDAITDATAPFQTAEWNSLAHMRLVLALEEATGTPLGPDQIVSIGGFPDVVALLS